MSGTQKEKADPETKGMLGGDPEADDSDHDGDIRADQLPVNKETACGIWFIRGAFLQKFANKKAFVFLHGVMGLIMGASSIYFGGTISTIEKRFKLNSKTTGFITVGNDVSTLMFGAIITYWAGKRGHKPRWIAVGVYTVVAFCLLNALPHFLYGSGEDALSLTAEFGNSSSLNSSVTQDLLERHSKQMLCKTRAGSEAKCTTDDSGGTGPAAILFFAQFISGIGGPLYWCLGTAYMDDNIKKSKTPALISISYFIRMLGPAIGSALSGYCLSQYIAPKLHPRIDNRDPRWLGAWWMGWIILGVGMFIMASLISLFPRQLPRSYYRRQRSKKPAEKSEVKDSPPSFKDFIRTAKRMLSNKIWVANTFAGIFYMIGYSPFWTFGVKYTEIMFKMSAARASFVKGTVGLGFSAVGLLASGAVLSKFKPSARAMAAWNVFVSIVTCAGLVSYAFLGCVTDDQVGLVEGSDELQTSFECNAHCQCDFVKYSPVCANGETFISPCHAGCANYVNFPNGSKIFTDCSCAKNQTASGTPLLKNALPGPCPPPPSCTTRFYIFLGIVCLLKFVGATGRASNFLVAMRCVDEKDKSASMGLGSFLFSLLAFIPAPIIFGYIIDTTCLVWGSTCSSKGNCWLYDARQLRYVLSFSGAFFISIGTCFDTGVWYLVKDLKVWDDPNDVKPVENGKEMKEMVNGKEMKEQVQPNGKPKQETQ